MSNKGKELKRRKDYYKVNKARITELNEHHRIKRKYGITLEQVEEMRTKQSGRCAICGNADKLVIDHCHATGKVRGLLCGFCNSGLGMFKDNANTLQAAITYLGYQ